MTKPRVCVDFRTTTSQKFEAVLRRARIQGSYTFVPLNSRLESNKGVDEEEEPAVVRAFLATHARPFKGHSGVVLGALGRVC